jgi:hypothetical protein
MVEQIRHVLRYVVNLAAFVVALLAMPEFGQVVPADWLPVIASVAATLNVVLTILRRLLAALGQS